MTEKVQLTPKQLDIMRHTVMGGSRELPSDYETGGFYRNRFVTGPGSSDYEVCNSLVEAGIMEVRRDVEMMGGSDCFSLSKAGLELADKLFSPGEEA